MSEHEQDEADARTAYRAIVVITFVVSMYFIGHTVVAICRMIGGWW